MRYSFIFFVFIIIAKNSYCQDLSLTNKKSIVFPSIDKKTGFKNAQLRFTNASFKELSEVDEIEVQLVDFYKGTNCCKLPDCRDSCERLNLNCETSEEDRKKCCDDCRPSAAIFKSIDQLIKDPISPGTYQITIKTKEKTIKNTENIEEGKVHVFELK